MVQPLDLAGVYRIFIFRVQLGSELDKKPRQPLVFLTALFQKQLPASQYQSRQYRLAVITIDRIRENSLGKLKINHNRPFIAR